MVPRYKADGLVADVGLEGSEPMATLLLYWRTCQLMLFASFFLPQDSPKPTLSTKNCLKTFRFFLWCGELCLWGGGLQHRDGGLSWVLDGSILCRADFGDYLSLGRLDIPMDWEDVFFCAGSRVDLKRRERSQRSQNELKFQEFGGWWKIMKSHRGVDDEGDDDDDDDDDDNDVMWWWGLSFQL